MFSLISSQQFFFKCIYFYLKDWWAFAISALWLLRSERHVALFFSLTAHAFNTADTEWKGLENKKGGRHKRKCNLNSKHSSVMRQWVTAMGAQTLKDTFKSLRATLGTWAPTCCRNIRLKAAAWEARGIQSDFLPALISLITQGGSWRASRRSFRLSLSMKCLKCSCCRRLNMTEPTDICTG